MVTRLSQWQCAVSSLLLGALSFLFLVSPLWQDQVQQGPKRNEEHQRLSTPSQVPEPHYKHQTLRVGQRFIFVKDWIMRKKGHKHLHKDRYPHLPDAPSCVDVAGVAQGCLTDQPCDEQSNSGSDGLLGIRTQIHCITIMLVILFHTLHTTKRQDTE